MSLTAKILIGVLVVFILAAGTFTYFRRKRNKSPPCQISRRAPSALELARDELAKADRARIDALKKIDALMKKDMTYPGLWDRDPRTVTPDNPQGMPVDDLIEVHHDSKEYWDVVDQLRADPEPSHATGSSQRRGMHDAWVTKLQRIQNLDLCAPRPTPPAKATTCPASRSYPQPMLLMAALFAGSPATTSSGAV